MTVLVAVAGLLQPFRGDGHGIGLSIVAAVAAAHAGSVQLTARPEGGLDARVQFTNE